MLTEFRNAVSCKKNSRSRRRRHLTSSGGGVLRHPSRLALAGPRPIRLVRDMRLSNGKLYSGTGSLTGGAPDLGPGPQRLLEEALGLNVSSAPPTLAVTPPTALIAPPPPPRSFLQGCSHVRICQECRRIQNLRPMVTFTPPPVSSASSRITPNPQHHQNLRLHYHYHHGSMSLPRLPPPAPPIAAERADSDGGVTVNSPRRLKSKPLPPPRPLPPAKTPTDLLGCHD